MDTLFTGRSADQVEVFFANFYLQKKISQQLQNK